MHFKRRLNIFIHHGKENEWRFNPCTIYQKNPKIVKKQLTRHTIKHSVKNSANEIASFFASQK